MLYFDRLYLCKFLLVTSFNVLLSKVSFWNLFEFEKKIMILSSKLELIRESLFGVWASNVISDVSLERGALIIESFLNSVPKSGLEVFRIFTGSCWLFAIILATSGFCETWWHVIAFCDSDFWSDVYVSYYDKKLK